jgi:hypothetical protein
VFVFEGCDRSQLRVLNAVIADRLESEGAIPGDHERFDAQMARTRLPIWFWVEGLAACARVFAELWCYARDDYEHVPTCFQKRALYWSLVAWFEDTDDRLDKDLEPYERQRTEEDLQMIEQIMNKGLGKTFDLIHVDTRVNDLLHGEDSEYVRSFPFEDLMDLTPPDIRPRVQEALKKRQATTG